MNHTRWQWMAALAAVLAVNLCMPADGGDDALPVDSAPVQETITIRGQAMKVWPFDDLRARGFEIPDVPREDNAFWTYLNAVNAFKDVPTELDDAYAYAVESAWPAGHDKLEAFMLESENQKALALAREASARGTVQLYYFGDPQGSVISVLLPSLSHFRQLGKLLVVDGRRLEAQGETDLAFRNYTAAMRMGHHVAGGITLIENLVGIAIWTLGDRAVEQMVLRRDLSREQLEDIRTALSDLAPDRPSTLNGMHNERVFGMTIVDEVTARPFQILNTIQNINGGGEELGSALAQQTTGWRRLETRIGQLVMPDRTIKKHMAQFYDQLIERAAKPAYDAGWLDFDEEGAVTAIPQWDVLAHMLLPSLSRASIIGERCRAQTLATRLSVALRLYALENEGQAPDRLSDLGDLVPAADLIDPFSGQPFVYDHREGAWRFYSFSENFVDDNGKEGDKPFDLDYVVRFPTERVEPFATEQAAADPS